MKVTLELPDLSNVKKFLVQHIELEVSTTLWVAGTITAYGATIHSNGLPGWVNYIWPYIYGSASTAKAWLPKLFPSIKALTTPDIEALVEQKVTAAVAAAQTQPKTTP